MTWWTKQPMRLIQTNLREIDAQLDPDAFIDSIQAYSGNVLLFILREQPTLGIHWHPWAAPFVSKQAVKGFCASGHSG